MSEEDLVPLMPSDDTLVRVLETLKRSKLKPPAQCSDCGSHVFTSIRERDDRWPELCDICYWHRRATLAESGTYIILRPALKDPSAPHTVCGACGFRAAFVHGDVCPGCGKRLEVPPTLDTKETADETSPHQNRS